MTKRLHVNDCFPPRKEVKLNDMEPLQLSLDDSDQPEEKEESWKVRFITADEANGLGLSHHHYRLKKT